MKFKIMWLIKESYKGFDTPPTKKWDLGLYPLNLGKCCDCLDKQNTVDKQNTEPISKLKSKRSEASTSFSLEY